MPFITPPLELRASVPALALIETKLMPPGQDRLRAFLAVTAPQKPVCRTVEVIRAGAFAIAAYANQRRNSGARLRDLAGRMNELAKQIETVAVQNDFPRETAFPLFRRLSQFQVWGLLTELTEFSPLPIILGTGAELALALDLRRPFRKQYASALRRANVKAFPSESKSHSICAKQILATLKKADAHFLGPDPSDPNTKTPASSSPAEQGTSIAAWYRNRIFYGADKDHQAVFDKRTISQATFLRECINLREQVALGSRSAIKKCIQGITHVPECHLAEIAILNGHETPNWTVAIDLGTGSIHTDLSCLVPKAAHPKQPEAVMQASWICVKPLPIFLWKAMLTLANSSPQSAKLITLCPDDPYGDAEDNVEPDIRQGMLKPTTARWIRTWGPFAVSLGIDRSLASLMCNDPTLVPSGKFYYNLVERGELHQTTSTLYEAIGWGEPAPLTVGRAFGSHVTPTDESVKRWHAHQIERLNATRPGNRTRVDSVLLFHNSYVVYVASMYVFLVNLRETAKLRVTSAELIGAVSGFLSLLDKRVGQYPGARPQVIADMLQVVIHMWFAHCHALRTRLCKQGFDDQHPLIRRIDKVLRGDPVHLFFGVSGRQQPTNLGTADLVHEWCSSLNLEPNWPRHFWLPALRKQGIKSTDADLFFRHQLRGDPPTSSVRNRILTEWHAQLSEAIGHVIRNLGIDIVPGLTRPENIRRPR